MYDYKTLLLAFYLSKYPQLIEKFEALNLFEDLDKEDITVDIKQIKTHPGLMKASLKGMKTQYDPDCKYGQHIKEMLGGLIELDPVAFIR